VSDATVDTSGVRQLLGEVQRMAAKAREEQLQTPHTTLSLYQRLNTAELAYEYDRTYGRPTNEDAHTR
jgi:hypothetical protein